MPGNRDWLFALYASPETEINVGPIAVRMAGDESNDYGTGDREIDVVLGLSVVEFGEADLGGEIGSGPRPFTEIEMLDAAIVMDRDVEW